MKYNKGIFKYHDEVWVEKYRPQNLDDIIMDKEIKEKLLSFIKDKTVSSLILEGPAGTCKSTI